jgi:hypothetical protein
VLRSKPSRVARSGRTKIHSQAKGRGAGGDSDAASPVALARRAAQPAVNTTLRLIVARFGMGPPSPGRVTGLRAVLTSYASAASFEAR